jgi:hypothetical protein
MYLSALAAIHDWDVLGYDVETAYQETTLDKVIYMYLPQDFYLDLSRSNYIRACMDSNKPESDGTTISIRYSSIVNS